MAAVLFSDAKKLAAYLRDGWEPFAVTDAQFSSWIWLRKRAG